MSAPSHDLDRGRGSVGDVKTGERRADGGACVEGATDAAGGAVAIATTPVPRTSRRLGRSLSVHGHVVATQQRVALIGVALVSLALNSWRLANNGLGNQYYTAAARSMSESWHNWFFLSLDRGGFISVDKPPVPLWINSAVVRIFGVSSWSVLLPGAIVGAAAVALLWVVVRRRFGFAAATIAALVLALSPVNVAVNRLNLPEPWLVLFLLAAVWAVQRAVEGDRLVRWSLLAGAFVGLAFNTKMLAAYLVVPPLGIALVAGLRTMRERALGAAALALATAAVSLPWLLIVDAVPASARPYVGGSTNNSVFDLIFGYNGIGRVNGSGIAAGPPSALGGVFGGQPGALRIFGDALSSQIAWLLPLAAVGAVAAVWLNRRHPARRAIVGLWVLWMVVVTIVFSSAQGTFHAYYTALLGPAVAALVGIGSASLVTLTRRDGRWWSAIAAAVGGTVAIQFAVSGRHLDFYAWGRWLLLGGVLAAAVLAAVGVARQATWRAFLVAGALGLAALLATPTLWAASETANPVLNATLPQAGPRRGVAGTTFGSVSSNGDPGLAAFLLAHDTGQRWQLVTASAQQAAGLIADQGLSVMALGGFMGTDPATSIGAIGRRVAAGEVRYFLVGNAFGSRRSITDGRSPRGIMAFARNVCTPVTTGVPLRYLGDLYDCFGTGTQWTSPPPQFSVY